MLHHGPIDHVPAGVARPPGPKSRVHFRGWIEAQAARCKGVEDSLALFRRQGHVGRIEQRYFAAQLPVDSAMWDRYKAYYL
jgi:hypothetical protein